MEEEAESKAEQPMAKEVAKDEKGEESKSYDENKEEIAKEPEEAVKALDNSTAADDSGDDSTVLVDHKDVEEEPRALQIVSIGTEEDSYAFTFHKEKLESIMKHIPSDTKVAVVSVVGAFRTGKSFLLSFFLRYLHHLTNKAKADGGQTKGRWFEEVESLGNDGFHWRAGSDRNTTGIWIWSHPHMLPDQNLAVLLVDTQGMFDNETTMGLTASIFGLSTLLSSYEVYNVDKMIGEDALQQLSLFTEYARAAMANSQEKEGEKPFQQIEFLVRDWQHFEEEEDCEEMAREMDRVLEKVMATREAKDLQETREQITMCFEKITCYGLVHPGFPVTKKSYAGEINKIEPLFLELLDKYCPRVFDNLAPKKIHGRELTGEELASFIESYAELFSSGASFPEASTMLEATAGANNTNATNLAIKAYKERMDKVAGPQCSNYLKSEELAEEHRLVMMQSLEVFDSIANFGSKRSIEKSKRNLMAKIDDDFEVYGKLNDSRNPLLGMEIYAIPLAVALVSYVARIIVDLTCTPWSSMCKSGSELFSHVYAVVFCFLLIVAATKGKQIADLFQRVKVMFEAVNNGSTPGVKAKTD